MCTFVMDGRCYCTQSYGGIQRYKLEILERLEDELKYTDNIRVEVLYPSHLQLYIHVFEKIKFIPVCIMLTLIGSVRKLNQRQNEFRSIIRTYHNH